MILKEKVAFITGGGRGLGRSIALALAREGARVVIMSRSSKELREVVSLIWAWWRGTLLWGGCFQSRGRFAGR